MVFGHKSFPVLTVTRRAFASLTAVGRHLPFKLGPNEIKPNYESNKEMIELTKMIRAIRLQLLFILSKDNKKKFMYLLRE